MLAYGKYDLRTTLTDNQLNDLVAPLGLSIAELENIRARFMAALP